MKKVICIKLLFCFALNIIITPAIYSGTKQQIRKNKKINRQKTRRNKRKKQKKNLQEIVKNKTSKNKKIKKVLKHNFCTSKNITKTSAKRIPRFLYKILCALGLLVKEVNNGNCLGVCLKNNQCCRLINGSPCRQICETVYNCTTIPIKIVSKHVTPSSINKTIQLFCSNKIKGIGCLEIQDYYSEDVFTENAIYGAINVFSLTTLILTQMIILAVIFTKEMCHTYKKTNEEQVNLLEKYKEKE